MKTDSELVLGRHSPQLRRQSFTHLLAAKVTELHQTFD